VLNNKNYFSELSILAIRSTEITNDLQVLGVVKRKTFIIKFPEKHQVPEKLLNHFIRGYLDGDGCIHVSKDKKKVCTSFVGTKHLIEGINKTINKELDISIKNYCEIKCKNGSIFQLSYHKEDSTKILPWLYKDAELFLERKFNKFKSIKSEWK